MTSIGYFQIVRIGRGAMNHLLKTVRFALISVNVVVFVSRRPVVLLDCVKLSFV